MRRIYFLFSFFMPVFVQSQNVGIGTNAPAARLHVADSAVLFTGPASMTLPNVTNYSPPASGAGARMMWYPQMGAFRAGYVNGSQWDKVNIGSWSVACGWGTIASADAAVAFGFGTLASGTYTSAFGIGTKATLNSSTAFGSYSEASGSASVAFGSFTKASGFYSSAFGSGTIASGLSSSSFGSGTKASGQHSSAFGIFSIAGGEGSAAFGSYTIAKSNNSLVIGHYNDTTNTNTLFEIGNGTANNDRRNVVTILENGNAGIGTTSPSLVSGGAGLNVVNDTYTQLRVQSSVNSAGIEFTPSFGRSYELQAGTNGNFFLYDRTVNQYRIVVDQNGRMGIGVANPTRPLSFPATLEKKISLYPGPTGDVGLSVSGNDLRIYSDNSNARVSFGYDNYSTGFVSRAYVPASGTTAFVVQGDLLVNSTTYSSDIRFKENIQPINGALEKLTSLRGVQYDMRVNEFKERNFHAGKEIGLIAQEVEQVFPELVRTGADGYKSVDYAKLVPVLIESVKTQQATISNLQELLIKQQEQMDQILKRIEKAEK